MPQELEDAVFFGDYIPSSKSNSFRLKFQAKNLLFVKFEITITLNFEVFYFFFFLKSKLPTPRKPSLLARFSSVRVWTAGPEVPACPSPTCR